MEARAAPAEAEIADEEEIWARCEGMSLARRGKKRTAFMMANMVTAEVNGYGGGAQEIASGVAV